MKPNQLTPILLLVFLLFPSLGLFGATADIYQDMESGTSGNALTGTIATGGSHGSGGSWGVTGTMWVSDQNEKLLRGPVTAGSVVYSDSTGRRTWACRNNTSSSYVSFDTSSSKGAIVTSCFLTIGPGPGLYEIYDAIVVGVGSVWAVCQINSRAGATTLWIEANNNGTVHSAEIPVTSGTTYWVSFKVDAAGGLASLDLFEIVNWTKVGSVTRSMNSGTVNLIRFGRADSHPTTSPTYTYFDDICINWTNTAFPFVPAPGTGQVPSAPGNLRVLP